jgi:hypothetical protein
LKGKFVGAGMVSCIPLTREALVRLRLKALRRGLWFREMSRDERSLVKLVIRVTPRVRSFFLARLLSSIVKKLLDALEGEVARLMRTVGRSLAQRLGGIAQGWGNRSAERWCQDSGFVQYLTIMHLNKP